MKANEDYAVLLAVADQGSLTAAAATLGRSLQSVSRTLAAMEQQLGVTLFNRTTRHVYPTPGCMAFIERIRPAVREIAAAREMLADQGLQLRGAIRLAAPTWFGTQHVAPVVADFMQLHGGVTIELVLSERHVDLAEERIDLSLRLGVLPSSDLKAKRIGTLRRVIFGAPAYFAARGHPRVPEDLSNHECLLRKSVDEETWAFGPDGRTVRVAGRFRSSHAQACNAAALAGLGVARAPLWQVQEYVEAGAVEMVLTGFEPEPAPVHLVWPGKRALPKRVRALVDFLAERIGAQADRVAMAG
ncbi:LysR family transcriptional regulator [Trinickia soli]|uniref:LysR family transcriptional regulator n=1 Tax=Trinickia soli TaxID=380675 RepID=A0A2N7W4F5_9BURK|nr:LysR family transcriptional regulator [Trinickia soli]PMS24282.1 LysR family transcriptional regulator [Trinickia soli]CAB3673572.1 HTH-type transcriptional regulator DmlR [Trinickia soli]